MENIFEKEEECLAACCAAPVMQVNHVYHENLDIEKVDEILSKIKMRENELNQTCYATLGKESPWSLKTYRDIGGYSAWETILAERPSPISSRAHKSVWSSRWGCGFSLWAQMEFYA